MKDIKRSSENEIESFIPQTARGRSLLELRQKIIAAGIPLQSPEEIDEELRS